MKNFIIIAAALFLSASPLMSEDLDAIFAKVKEFTAQKNYTKALEELSWAKREIEQLNSKKIETYFPDSLAGYKGAKIESNSVLGITNIEREYKDGAKSVKLSLTGGSASGAGGGLAAFGKMAAMMGGQQGSDTVRIKGRTATIEESNSSTSITIFMDSGSMLKFESYDSADVATLRKMAEELDMDGLDAYQKGGK